jgi:hypothetical protein
MFQPRSIRTYEIGRGNKGDLHDLWEDALGPYSWLDEGAHQRTLHEGMCVTLKDFTLSEWVPRTPGMSYSKAVSSESSFYHDCSRALKLTINQLFVEDKFPDFDAWPSDAESVEYLKKESRKIETLARGQEATLTGGGALRFGEHKGLKLMSANENRGSVENGYPVVLTAGAFDKIKKDIQRDGAIHVEELSGYLRRIPRLPLNINLPITYSGMPKLALLIDSRLNIKGSGTPDKLTASAWNVLSNGTYLSEDFQLGYNEHEQEIVDAIDSIVACKRSFFPRESVMLEVDDIVPRFAEAKLNYRNFTLNTS